MILIPLSETYVKPGSITNTLKKLAHTLRTGDGLNALIDAKPEETKKYWGWLKEYLLLQPNFIGFGVNLNKIIDDLFSKGN